MLKGWTQDGIFAKPFVAPFAAPSPTWRYPGRFLYPAYAAAPVYFSAAAGADAARYAARAGTSPGGLSRWPPLPCHVSLSAAQRCRRVQPARFPALLPAWAA